MEKERGSIAFFATYRPPVPLDIFSSQADEPSKEDELPMTDKDSYNYNGQAIPPEALDMILAKVAGPEEEENYESEEVGLAADSGILFISERTNNLETLHIALHLNDQVIKVLNLADVYGTETFKGVRMEDSGCIAGDYLVYVTTKDPALERRQPWTAVYKTHLQTGDTLRLTPPETADLSPSVSPSGKKIAVATFQFKTGGWTGEIEDLQTHIAIVDLENPLDRRLVVSNGGWPTWGSEDVLFFHRRVERVIEVIDKNSNEKKRKIENKWGVFRADISNGYTIKTDRVTPEDIDAMTPAAIDSTTVAAATIRDNQGMSLDPRSKPEHYRHIEIFKYSSDGPSHDSKKITEKVNPLADHYNPFVIEAIEEGKRIGYHRGRTEDLKSGEVARRFEELESPEQNVGLMRVSGVFPTFSKDGTKLAFVDNEFKAVWLADKKGLRKIHELEDSNKVFSPVWNQKEDTLYICVGPSFSAASPVQICALENATSRTFQDKRTQLTTGEYNDAFPSSSPDGKCLVFRSTRDWIGKEYKLPLVPKNLYIMNAKLGEFKRGKRELRRLTEGEWIDTHCQWSPKSDWIVFSSTRHKPEGSPALDNGLDLGYFAVFLVSSNDSSARAVRVIGSREYDLAGHINHPFFSPDGCSIVFASDMAAISAEPISLPIFLHSVRPYGDIFSVDIDPDHINNNEDVKKVTRITHSRYENSTPCWTYFSVDYLIEAWNRYLSQCTPEGTPQSCPYKQDNGGESWLMTGHLCISKRCC